ncbi:hypothetical protein Taro_046832 [Colocasia esculenta]|uniref:Uncharacterized protein n=1 Tax=Colocasia esculenta TaxID=4460 RepID=A0A843WZN6_COLES|nr:hypothetical protein [Colocasia esculenta]
MEAGRDKAGRDKVMSRHSGGSRSFHVATHRRVAIRQVATCFRVVSCRGAVSGRVLLNRALG